MKKTTCLIFVLFVIGKLCYSQNYKYYYHRHKLEYVTGTPVKSVFERTTLAMDPFETDTGKPNRIDTIKIFNTYHYLYLLDPKGNELKVTAINLNLDTVYRSTNLYENNNRIMRNEVYWNADQNRKIYFTNNKCGKVIEEVQESQWGTWYIKRFYRRDSILTKTIATANRDSCKSYEVTLFPDKYHIRSVFRTICKNPKNNYLSKYHEFEKDGKTVIHSFCSGHQYICNPPSKGIRIITKNNNQELEVFKRKNQLDSTITTYDQYQNIISKTQIRNRNNTERYFTSEDGTKIKVETGWRRNVDKYFYEYQFDRYNNWIKKLEYRNGTLKKTSEREIIYYE